MLLRKEDVGRNEMYRAFPPVSKLNTGRSFANGWHVARTEWLKIWPHMLANVNSLRPAVNHLFHHALPGADAARVHNPPQIIEPPLPSSSNPHHMRFHSINIAPRQPTTQSKPLSRATDPPTSPTPWRSSPRPPCAPPRPRPRLANPSAFDAHPLPLQPPLPLRHLHPLGPWCGVPTWASRSRSVRTRPSCAWA